MSNDDSSSSRTEIPRDRVLTAEEVTFLNFLADRALEEWLKRPAANDNEAPPDTP